MENLLDWVTQYGYWGIFSLLVLGIVGLPVPDETMLAFAGYLVYRRVLLPVPTAIAALMGSLCGITVSYTLGRTAGLRLLRRYGRFFHITDERIEKVHGWFERIGCWTLPAGYFVPGVRHLIAVVAGASRLRYPVFALFAYAGGLVWTLTFLSIGFFFGSEWNLVVARIHRHLRQGIGFALALFLAAFVIWRSLKSRV